MEATATPERSQNGAAAPAADPARSFLRPHLLSLAPYTPIEPFEVLSQRLGRAPEDIIKLDANENPYGPPPEVLQALGALAFPNIYPDPESRALRDDLGRASGVPAENLLVGIGKSAAAKRWRLQYACPDLREGPVLRTCRLIAPASSPS
jgi:hypothetical protein